MMNFIKHLERRHRRGKLQTQACCWESPSSFLGLKADTSWEQGQGRRYRHLGTWGTTPRHRAPAQQQGALAAHRGVVKTMSGPVISEPEDTGPVHSEGSPTARRNKGGGTEAFQKKRHLHANSGKKHTGHKGVTQGQQLEISVGFQLQRSEVGITLGQSLQLQ